MYRSTSYLPFLFQEMLPLNSERYDYLGKGMVLAPMYDFEPQPSQYYIGRFTSIENLVNECKNYDFSVVFYSILFDPWQGTSFLYDGGVSAKNYTLNVFINQINIMPVQFPFYCLIIFYP